MPAEPKLTPRYGQPYDPGPATTSEPALFREYLTGVDLTKLGMSRFAIPADVDIDKLGLPPEWRRLAEALQRHGAILP